MSKHLRHKTRKLFENVLEHHVDKMFKGRNSVEALVNSCLKPSFSGPPGTLHASRLMNLHTHEALHRWILAQTKRSQGVTSRHAFWSPDPRISEVSNLLCEGSKPWSCETGAESSGQATCCLANWAMAANVKRRRSRLTLGPPSTLM